MACWHNRAMHSSDFSTSKRLLFATALCAYAVTATTDLTQAQSDHFVQTFAHGAVASDHPAASEAGAQILRQGGSAADAAAATMLALGVANPASSGLGGGGFALYYRAQDASLTFIDFRETAPKYACAQMYQGQDKSLSQVGGLATGIPGEPAGVVELVERFGNRSLQEVVAPALAMAQQGVELTPRMQEYMAYLADALRKDPWMSQWFDASGQPLKVLKRPGLIKALQRLHKRGGRGMYRGPFARHLAKNVREAGGIIRKRDLRGYKTRDRNPLIENAFGYRWVSAPPPSAGGFTLMQSLLILQGIVAMNAQPSSNHALLTNNTSSSMHTSLAAMDTTAYLHALAESWKGPFIDRQRYFGDPDYVDLPLADLSAQDRLTQRAALFSPTSTTSPTEYALPIEALNDNIVQPDNAGTAHLCVVDQDGNVAAVTTTINLAFGARYTANGVVMNDEMDDFASAVGQANAFGLIGGARNLPAPGKRPVSTMSPTIVFANDQPVLCIGASGGSRIVTATEQVALSVLARGQTLEQAIKAPRVHHQGQPDTLRTEEFSPLDESFAQALRALGHDIQPIRNVAVVQAIQVHRDADGHVVNLEAAADPRKGGQPAGH